MKRLNASVYYYYYCYQQQDCTEKKVREVKGLWASDIRSLSVHHCTSQMLRTTKQIL